MNLCSLTSIHQSHPVLSKTASASWFVELQLPFLPFRSFFSLVVLMFPQAALKSKVRHKKLRKTVKNGLKLCMVWLLGAFQDWIGASWIWRGLLCFLSVFHVKARESWSSSKISCLMSVSLLPQGSWARPCASPNLHHTAVVYRCVALGWTNGEKSWSPDMWNSAISNPCWNRISMCVCVYPWKTRVGHGWTWRLVDILTERWTPYLTGKSHLQKAHVPSSY